MTASAKQFERGIRELTRPINDQYPRPWMTSSTQPLSARVFIVGQNQKNGYNVARVGSHDHFIDSLFNRGSESCRQLYDRIAGASSETRKNTDVLTHLLATRGVTDVIETNVICYSTPMSADLRLAQHIGGAERGTEIFNFLLNNVKPKVIIAHGSETSKVLGRALGIKLPKPPRQPVEPVSIGANEANVFVIPSLAPPGYNFNKWPYWCRDHMSKISDQVASILAA